MKRVARRMVQAGALVAASTGVAHAQSSVTLYGLIDEAVRYTTHNATGVAGQSKSLVSLQEGAFNGPRWGLLGTEDLGSGMKAFFRLENGFNTNTGKFDQNGQEFGRQAYVGLSAPTWGELRLGRQYGAMYNFMALVDPIYTGNIGDLFWQDYLTGLRFDNTADYTNSYGPVHVDFQYSFGNQAGDAQAGRTMGGVVSYVMPWLTAGVSVQESYDATNHQSQVGLLGAKGTYGKFSLYAYYTHSTKDAGFTVGTGGTTTPLANTTMASNTTGAGRLDSMTQLGASYRFTPAFTLIASWMLDYAHVGGNSGRLQTFYSTAIYQLSKTVDVYAEADYSRLSGLAKYDTNPLLATFGGANTRLGVMGGLRVRF